MSVMPPGGFRPFDGLDTVHEAVSEAAEAATSAPPSFDVTAIDAAALDAMKRDPAQAQLGWTIANARMAYADSIAAGGRVLVTTSAGNGGLPVVVVVPPNFDPAKPARVHTHYHGWNSTAAEPRGHGAGVTHRMQQVQAQDPQTVFVFPECKSMPARDTSKGSVDYKSDWSSVTSQAQTTEDALAAAGIADDMVGTRVVSAHSGGGAALDFSIAAHPDGSGIRADQLELQDCLYGVERSLPLWAATANGQAASRIVYFHGTNDAPRAAALPQAFGARWATPIDAARLPPPTEAQNPVLKDRNGKPIKLQPWEAPRRAFANDPHNRTVGQFMDYRG